tara:strand:+ start:78 stop:422 length:345 start_codon:yes stop_codon:yes gene_type:complete
MNKQRDLLLVPFPFSDQSGKKVRPVVIISNNSFNEEGEDVLVVGVTSNIIRDQYTIQLTNKDLEEGKLLTTSFMKAENLLKIEKDLIIKKIGKIKKQKFKEVMNGINNICKEEP